ncbi:MAG: chlorophyllide reductase subunit Z, partial [Chlorobium sp.]
VWLLQEIVNALYDMLFNFLPIQKRTGTDEPPQAKMAWSSEAETLLNEMVKKAPFISQISFGRELKKRAENLARKTGNEIVTAELLRGIN